MAGSIKNLYKTCIRPAVTPVVPFIAYWYLRLLRATMRISYVNDGIYSKRLSEGKGSIFAFWHGRLAMMPFAYRGRGLSILVSNHRDGELISRTVRIFGIGSVRGSSTRGWFGAVRGLLSEVKRGRDIAITPDGPRGPGMKAQMGAIQIAKSTGLPIIPVTFSASKKKFSGPGTLSSSPSPFQGGSSSSGSRYTWTPVPKGTRWRQSASSSRRDSMK